MLHYKILLWSLVPTHVFHDSLWYEIVLHVGVECPEGRNLPSVSLCSTALKKPPVVNLIKFTEANWLWIVHTHTLRLKINSLCLYICVMWAATVTTAHLHSTMKDQMSPYAVCGLLLSVCSLYSSWYSSLILWSSCYRHSNSESTFYISVHSTSVLVGLLSWYILNDSVGIMLVF